MVLMYALYEHASGYALFLVKEFEEVGFNSRRCVSYYIGCTLDSDRVASKVIHNSALSLGDIVLG